MVVITDELPGRQRAVGQPASQHPGQGRVDHAMPSCTIPNAGCHKQKTLNYDASN